MRFFRAHGFFVSDRINRMDKMTSENVNGENSVGSVHSVVKPLPNGATGTSDIEGKAATGSGERGRSRTSFNSRKIYVSGKIHPDIRVPFREISLASTKSINGEIEINEPVRVYDTSGPWGDPSVTLDPVQGLPPLRRGWILKRGDVDEIEGRVVRPIDDGYLSDKHSAIAAKRRSTFNGAGAPSRRKPLCASADHPVTQLWYARQGITTPEMEFIAIRENLGRPVAGGADLGRPNGSREAGVNGAGHNRDNLGFAHPGESFGANIPREITPEFVRQEIARGRA